MMSLRAKSCFRSSPEELFAENAVIHYPGSPTIPNSPEHALARFRAQLEATPDYRIDICVATDKAIVPNEAGIIEKIIPGGPCAKMRHVGSNDGLRDSISFLYRDWLPESGEELRDFPVYFHYLNLDHDTPEHRHLTEVYLPLK